MAERNLPYQEREILDAIRRAKSTPDRSSNLRKDVLRRLIGLTHSPHPQLKLIVALNIPVFFDSFPDVEEDAINAVYDICEDQTSNVRIQGYNAIVEISKQQTKWIKRNADVLIQLLQSDEPKEVQVVKNSLVKHIDMDPKVTLGVCCDQIFPSDEPMDDDEQSLRDRLRNLVINFLTNEAKRPVIRHATPGSPPEEVLMSRILPGISKLTHDHVTSLIKETFIPLQSLQSSTPQREAVLQTLIMSAKSELRPDAQPDATSNIKFYTDLAAQVSVQPDATPSSEFLRLYFSSLLGKMTLQKIPQELRTALICYGAEYLVKYDKESTSLSEARSIRKQVTDSVPVLFQFLSNVDLDDRVKTACQVLLKICHRRKNEDDWTVPQYFSSALASFGSRQASGDNWTEVQLLIRSLQPPPPSSQDNVRPGPPSTRTVLASPANTSLPRTRLEQISDAKAPRNPLIRRPSEAAASLISLPKSAISPGTQSSSAPPSSSNELQVKRGSTNDEPSSRPMKRTKNEADPQAPSLLDRITSGRQSNGSTPRRARSPQSSQQQNEKKRSGKDANTTVIAQPESKQLAGFSIKGAAKAAAQMSSMSLGPDSPAHRPSLLDRLDSTNSEQKAGSSSSSPNPNSNQRRKRKQER